VGVACGERTEFYNVLTGDIRSIGGVGMLAREAKSCRMEFWRVILRLKPPGMDGGGIVAALERGRNLGDGVWSGRERRRPSRWWVPSSALETGFFWDTVPLGH